MVLNNKSKILIKNLYLFKNYYAKKKFLERIGNSRTLNYVLKKLRKSDSTGRKPAEWQAVYYRRSLMMRLMSDVLG